MTMPALGESVTEGTVTRWLKQVGDTIEVDEPLLEVSTDKVDTEIPSPVAGTVLEIKVHEDETADVGAELAIIGAPGARPGRRTGAQPGAAGPRPSRLRRRRPRLRQRRRGPQGRVGTRPGHRCGRFVVRRPRARGREVAGARERPGGGSAARAEPGGAPGGGDGHVERCRRRRLRDPAGPQARRRARASTCPRSPAPGVGGRIRKQDVIEAAEKAAAAAAAGGQARCGRGGGHRTGGGRRSRRRARCVAAPRS